MGEVEQRVLLALRNYLLAPDVVASAVEAYQAERKCLAEERRRSRHKLEAAATEVERKIARLLTLVENGHADPVATGPRINELVAERKRLAAALSQQPASNVLEFFPKAADRYREKVADIHAALSRGEAGDREAIAVVRSLIGRIVVHATSAPEPLGLEVEGSLAALMSDAPELEHSGISCCMPPQPSPWFTASRHTWLILSRSLAPVCVRRCTPCRKSFRHRKRSRKDTSQAAIV